MKCKKCGSDISCNQKFCGVCGAPAPKRRWPLVVGGGLGVILVAAGVTAVLALTGVIQLDGLLGGEGDLIGYVDGDFVQLTSGFTDVKVTDEDSALEALDDVAPALGVEDTEDQLEPAESSNALDTTYYRYSQTYEGIPVYGRGITMGADENGEAVLLTSNYLPLDGAEIETEPDITEDEALEIVRQEESDAPATSCGLCIYSLNETDPVLAWQVAVSGEGGEHMALVGAHDGSILASEPIVANADLEGKGKNGEQIKISVDGEDEGPFLLYSSDYNITGYNANQARVGFIVNTLIDNDGNSYSVTTDDLSSVTDSTGAQWRATCIGTGTYWIERDGQGRTAFFHEVGLREKSLTTGNNTEETIDVCGGDADSLFAKQVEAVTAFAHAETVLDYYEDVFQSKGYDNAGGSLLVAVNAWRGLGDNGNSSAMPLAPHTAYLEFGPENELQLDAIAHEVAHAYQFSAGATPSSGETGSIQEAASDFFAAAVEEHALEGGTDWIQGKTRNLRTPGESGNGPCPVKYKGDNWGNTDPSSVDSGGIHQNSTVLSHAFYSMAMSDSLGGDRLSVDLTAQLVYLTAQATTRDCTFKQYRIISEQVAMIMQRQGLMTSGQVDRVRAAYDEAEIPASEAREIRAEKKRMKLQLGDHFNGMGDDIDVDLDDSYGQEISDVLKELAEQYGVVETGTDTYAGSNGSGITQLVPSERLNGLLSASVDDYDGDGEAELLVIRSDLEAGWWTSSARGGTEGPLELEMYERESNGYELADSEEIVVGGLADNYPVASVQVFVGEHDGDSALYVDYSANFNDQWTTTLGFTYDGAFEQIGGWAVYEHYNSVRCYEAEGSDAQATLRVDDSAKSGWRKAYELSWGEGAAPEDSFFDEYRDQYVSALDAIGLEDKYPRSYALTENAPIDESFWMCSIEPSEHFSVSGGGDVTELCGILSLSGGSGNGAELTCYDRTGLLDSYRTGSAQTGSESGSGPGDNNDRSDRDGFAARVVEETVTFASHSYAEQSPGPDTARTWSYPQFSGGEPSGALEDLNKRIKDEFDEMVEDARAWTSSDASMYTEEYNVDIAYCKDGIASVREERYEYGGGAHGMSAVTGSTYDLRTGEEVSVGKALGDGESGLSLASAAETGLREFFTEHPEEYSAGDPSTASFDDIVNDPDRYYITDDGVVFVTRPYEFGPYGNGWHEILVTSFKTADLLYQDVRDKYE